MTDIDEDEVAHGWDAIDAACNTIYPTQEPKHYGTIISYRLGGNDPLQGISAYKRMDPAPHWHYVTYGFTELYSKESDDAEISGYGFELTLRLRCEPDAEDPPMWVINFLQNLARYVFKTGNIFRDGDWLAANGPIAVEEDTRLTYVAFTADPELPTQQTPNGEFEFLQVIGLTEDEAYAARLWRTLDLLEVLRPHMPLYITDLARDSLLGQPGVQDSIERGRKESGSSTGYVYTDELDWRQEKRLLGKPTTIVTLGALQVQEATTLLPLRLPFGRDLRLLSNNKNVVFAPGENALRTEDDVLYVTLDDATVDEIASLLQPRRGEYPLKSFKGLRIDVRPTEVKDPKGNVVQTIG
ncbi:Suppressor of fused protein (SUFU) [Bordetella ansorpii]|uniref:Suppressor of fused protein (SUFU) n=1 Tax=Bordetella ansorpii TaxID=288768 RepID=A0A146AHM7_9BORD|nr:suppressor of fused domain protein [Bordetella ansorpii]CZZ88623.1 Suppressor of fused protein (SUFU) [Bordetella ansorpii]